MGTTVPTLGALDHIQYQESSVIGHHVAFDQLNPLALRRDVLLSLCMLYQTLLKNLVACKVGIRAKVYVTTTLNDGQTKHIKSQYMSPLVPHSRNSKPNANPCKLPEQHRLKRCSVTLEDISRGLRVTARRTLDRVTDSITRRRRSIGGRYRKSEKKNTRTGANMAVFFNFGQLLSCAAIVIVQRFTPSEYTKVTETSAQAARACGRVERLTNDLDQSQRSSGRPATWENVATPLGLIRVHLITGVK
ncbi:hypothetical protein EVAR_69777_1 [Eumeta japonica]|uniref:Uncharacterized protein n=1 Tax=Eumeta variegata TaxID=151549 RepID=A0A4C2A9X2_EUMVA|nr:hypothetical protein EVAR_69777_1 [Eumeta japonica]